GGHKHDTLVALWERGDITDKEKLVRAIAEDVWLCLSQAVDDDLPLPIDRRLAYYRPQFDPHVRDGTAQSPTAVTREGEDDAFDLIPVLTEWATSPEAPNRYFALLGSFGSGKTTTVQLLAQTLLTEFRENANNPLPVYLDFRRLQQAYALDESRQFSLAELILQCLHQDQTDQIDATSLLTTLRGRACVILFDGLDEIGMRVGVERASALYRQLIEIVPAEARHRDQATGRADWAACPIRILISCRTHFFRDHIDERSTLAGHDRDGPGRTSQLMRTAYMAPFTPKQIQSFLTCHLGTEKGQAAFQTLWKIHDLPGLAKKPIMTRYIAEVMPELKADADAGRQINVATVYQRLFRQAVERDRGKRGKLTPGDREAILQALAHSLWQQRAATLPVTALEDWFDDYCATRPGLSRMLGSGDNRELMHTELRNSTLLERSGKDHFRFTHTSFQEYFLARGLRDLLVKGAMATLTKAPPVSVETIDFLADIADTDACWRAVADGVAAVLTGQGSADVRQLAVALFRRLRHRSSMMFVPPRLNLVGLDLSGDRADWLSQRQLDGADLSGATLLGADLRQVQFRTCLLEGTILGSVAFDRCTFTACSGAPRSLASARAFACEDPDDFLPNGGLVLDFPTGGKNFRVASPPSYLLRPHLQTVRSASFSHDGARIVTSSDDSTARVWDARSGQTLLTLSGHQRTVTSGSFSHDGARIVTSSNDNTAHVWDAKTGQTLLTLSGHQDNVTSASFCQDGSCILTSSDDRTARVWDAETGQTLLTLEGHQEAVTSASFSHDGARIVTSSLDTTARVWDARSEQTLLTLCGHQDYVTSASFSQDGSRIVTSSLDTTARVWDARSEQTPLTLSGHQDYVTSASFSHDGSRIVTSSLDTTARVWDAKTGRVLTLSGHQDGVTSASFSHDGARIVTGSDDNTARVWDAKSGQTLLIFSGHQHKVTSASFSQDGSRIVTSSNDKTARVWDARSGQTLLTLEGHKAWVTSASFSHNGSRIVTSSLDDTARVWDANTGKELERHRARDFDRLGGNPTTRSPDGTRILKIDGEATQICDAATGKPILIRVHINDAWFVIDENDVVLRMSENGWRHIYGKELGPDGQIRIVAPRMPEVVSG
ncbi:MAG: NACHT domain-containing protein, partial [Alphaproteobacteria bacterium]|nr:NACHT domain-containing protein [Alphaproteobacteria bacterium]